MARKKARRLLEDGPSPEAVCPLSEMDFDFERSTSGFYALSYCIREYERRAFFHGLTHGSASDPDADFRPAQGFAFASEQSSHTKRHSFNKWIRPAPPDLRETRSTSNTLLIKNGSACIHHPDSPRGYQTSQDH